MTYVVLLSTGTDMAYIKYPKASKVVHLYQAIRSHSLEAVFLIRDAVSWRSFHPCFKRGFTCIFMKVVKGMNYIEDFSI